MLAILQRQTFELVSFLPVKIACCQVLTALNIQIHKTHLHKLKIPEVKTTFSSLLTIAIILAVCRVGP